MKIILIHGIGENDPGWSDALNADQILGVAPDRIVEFHYDDLMAHTWLSRLLVRAAKMFIPVPAAVKAISSLQDYVNDILMYFVVPGVRAKILKRLSGVLREYPDAIVMGYSLGSIVAYETLKIHPQDARNHILVTLGSPLGSPLLQTLVKRFLKVPDFTRPNVPAWFNLYSPLDVLSGRIDGLGCHPQDQFRVKVFHNMQTYLYHTKRLLPHIFKPVTPY